jgi:hypothetical protein
MPTSPATEAMLTMTQKRQKPARDQVHSAHVDVHQSVEIIRLGGIDSSHVANARVVHQNVEPVELRHSRGNRSRIGYIQMKCLAGPDGIGQSLGRCKVDIGNPHMGSGARQFPHRCLTDAARAPGYQRMAAVKAKYPILRRRL